MGSQCSFSRRDVEWWWRDAKRMSLAEKFWVFWRGWMTELGVPTVAVVKPWKDIGSNNSLGCIAVLRHLAPKRSPCVPVSKLRDIRRDRSGYILGHNVRNISRDRRGCILGHNVRDIRHDRCGCTEGRDQLVPEVTSASSSWVCYRRHHLLCSVPFPEKKRRMFCT